MIGITKQGFLTSLQVLRGIAAVSVICTHAVVSTRDFVEPVPEMAFQALHLGYLGVDFFFVLSGFILAFSFLSRNRSHQRAADYIVARFARLYPAYLPVSLGLVLAYSILPDLSESGGREFGLISSLLLLPTQLPPALSVAWALIHEIHFYLVFSVVYLSRLAAVFVFTIWALLIVVINHFGLAVSAPLLYLFSPLNLEFMIGAVTAMLFHRPVQGRFQSPLFTVAAVGSATLVLTTLIWLLPDFAIRLVLATGFAAVIARLVLIEQKHVLKWPQQLLIIGNASYSIYLVHNPLLSVTQRVAGILEWNWIPALLLGILCSIIAGVLYSRVVEFPLTRMCRRLFRTQGV